MEQQLVRRNRQNAFLAGPVQILLQRIFENLPIKYALLTVTDGTDSPAIVAIDTQ